MCCYSTVSVLVLIFMTLDLGSGSTFDRCDLARKLLHEYGFPAGEIDDWVCLARWESHYNSSAVGTLNPDGSKDLGMFQISEKYWCEWGKAGKACSMKCEDLLDDRLDDDVKCVKRIYKEHKGLSGNGFNAWVAWQTRCQGDLSEYVESCSGLDKNVTAAAHNWTPGIGFLPGIVAPPPLLLFTLSHLSI